MQDHAEETSTNLKIKLQLPKNFAGKTNLVLLSRIKNHRIPITLKHKAATKHPGPLDHQGTTKTTHINLQKAQQPKNSSTREITKQH